MEAAGRAGDCEFLLPAYAATAHGGDEDGAGDQAVSPVASSAAGAAVLPPAGRGRPLAGALPSPAPPRIPAGGSSSHQRAPAGAVAGRANVDPELPGITDSRLEQALERVLGRVAPGLFEAPPGAGAAAATAAPGLSMPSPRGGARTDLFGREATAIGLSPRQHRCHRRRRRRRPRVVRHGRPSAAPPRRASPPTPGATPTWRQSLTWRRGGPHPPSTARRPPTRRAGAGSRAYPRPARRSSRVHARPAKPPTTWSVSSAGCFTARQSQTMPVWGATPCHRGLGGSQRGKSSRRSSRRSRRRSPAPSASSSRARPKRTPPEWSRQR